MTEIYPVTIVRDRYSGSYSGGTWIAWNLDYDEIPEDSQGGDMNAFYFWEYTKIPYGIGATPDEALKDLEEFLNEKR